MAFTSITKPVQGDPTKKVLADAIIDDLNYLYNQIAGVSGLNIPNGSFEADNDADSLPDQWTRTLYAGGSFSLTGDGLGDTECQHGRRAIKFISPGGAGNGGGYITTNDFIEVNPGRGVWLSWMQKATAASVRVKAQILWYTAAQVSISTTDLYSSVANPTAWALKRASTYPPATARYCKIRLIGAEDTATTAGTVYFDDVRMLQPSFDKEISIDSPGTHNWTCPTGVTFLEVECYGAGGGSGGSAGATKGGGGGAGGFVRTLYPVTAGTVYTFTIGTGGTAGSDVANGGNGSATIWDAAAGSPPTANGGSGGQRGAAGGLGGAGGTASNGDLLSNGGAGENGGGGTDGGDGGFNPPIGVYPEGAAGAGIPGIGYCSGAAGAGNATGAAGSNGLLILRF